MCSRREPTKSCDRLLDSRCVIPTVGRYEPKLNSHSVIELSSSSLSGGRSSAASRLRSSTDPDRESALQHAGSELRQR